MWLRLRRAAEWACRAEVDRLGRPEKNAIVDAQGGGAAAVHTALLLICQPGGGAGDGDTRGDAVGTTADSGGGDGSPGQPADAVSRSGGEGPAAPSPPPRPLSPPWPQTPGSRRRDCHFADIPSLVSRSFNVDEKGVVSRMTVSPTANPRADARLGSNQADRPS